MDNTQKLQVLGIVRDWAKTKQKEYHEKCNECWSTNESYNDLHCWYYRTYVRLDILDKPHLHYWAKSISVQEANEKKARRNRRKKQQKKRRNLTRRYKLNAS